MMRNLTGAHYGLMTWLYQRITALIMLVIGIIFAGLIVYMSKHVTSDIHSWQLVFQCIWVKIFVQIFFLSLCIHAWVGIRDLWMDYIHHGGLRLILHVLSILWLLGSFIYSVTIIWM